MSDIPCLNIHRLQAEYLVAAQHPEPEQVKARLDKAVSHSLALALPVALGPHFAGAKAGIWLIRRLQVAVEVNANWESELLAQTWARQIAGALAETLSAGGDGENVLWFPSRPAFLARFLADVANGCAWGKWYYELFDGLRLLPASAVLRTAICEEPAAGLAALQQLSEADLGQVLRLLTGPDTRRILDRLAENEQSDDQMRCWRAAWSAWERLALSPGQPADEPGQALRLYLVATQVDDQADGPALRTAALTLTRLARRLAQSTLAQAETLLARLAGGNLADLYLAAGPAEAEALSPLLACPPDWVRQIGERLLAHEAAPAAVQSDPGPEHRETAFGGLFLLLPLLDELPLAEATTDWPAGEQTPAPVLVRFLLLIKCCGQGRAGRLFYDPLGRELLGIPAGLTLSELAGWQSRVTAQNRASLRATLGRWQRGRGIADGEIYVLARTPGPGAPLAVLVDGGRGVWLDAWPDRQRALGKLAAGLHAWLKPEEGAEPLLLCDPGLLERLGAESLPCPALSLPDEAVQALAGGKRSLGELLARLDKLADDLAYLALPRSFGLGPGLDRALSITAQGLLRALAWRLPGFAFSSLPYLYTNFLDFRASLEDQPGRRLVRLGRPPLNLILNITGLARQTYRLSWLDERPVVLFVGD